MSSNRLEQRDAEARLDGMLTEYHKSLPFLDYRIPFANKDPLRDAVEASPELKARLVEAVREGYLTKFSNERAEDGAAASYSATERKIVVPEKGLADRAELVFTLGHENAHALSTRGINFREEVTRPAIEAISRGPQPHDYTAPIKALIDRTIAEEAQAHIGGFNAAVSALGRQKIEPSPENLYRYNPGRMRDFIDVQGAYPDVKFAMKPGLTRGDDGMLLRSDQNIETMKAYYPEKIPGSFGENHLLNYRHQAAMDGWTIAHSVEKLALGAATGQKVDEIRRDQDAAWDAALKSAPKGEAIDLGGFSSVPIDVPDIPEPDVPKLLRDAGLESRQYKIDFAQLGLNPALLDVSKGAQPDGTVTVNNTALDLRDDFPRGIVVDRRTGEAQLERDANAARLAREREAVAPEVASASVKVANPDAMQSKLYMQAIEGLRGANLDAVKGNREAMLNVAASLALKAQAEGLTSIDHVVKGEKGNVFAIQGPDARTLGAPRADVDVATAAKRPSGESLGDLHVNLSRQAQQQAVNPAQEQQQPNRLTQ